MRVGFSLVFIMMILLVQLIGLVECKPVHRKPKNRQTKRTNSATHAGRGGGGGVFSELGGILAQLGGGGKVDAVSSSSPGDTCVFKCPGNLIAIPKRDHIATTNGCGSGGFKIDVSQYDQMEGCCDEHDKCYHTCGNTRGDCDDKSLREGCMGASQMMSIGASALGCSTYKHSQLDACECVDRSTRQAQIDEL